MTKKSMIRGAAILAAAGLVNRFLGAVSRIVLPTLIGDSGVGLYQMAYPVYGMFLVISTAGIPVAVSKLVAEQVAQRNKARSEEHTSELQSHHDLVCRLLLEKNFFNDTATTEIYTLSLHDALPILIS